MINVTPIRLVTVSLILIASAAASHAQTCQWAKQSNGNNTDFSASNVTDAAGNMYMTGAFDGAQLNIGGATLANPYPVFGTPSAYIAKFDSSGNVIWAKLIGGGDMNLAYDITMDGAGNLYVYGNFFDTTLVLGATTLINASNFDNFLVKLDTSGNPIWARAEHLATTFGNDFATCVAADNSGHIIVAGAYDDSITIGTTTLSSSGGQGGVYVARYDTAGNALWAKSSDGAGYASMNTIALDNSGNIYMAGDFEAGPTITFGDSTINSVEGSDMFVAKYSPAGTALWARDIPDSSFSSINDMAVDNAGNLYVVGLLNNPAITLGSYTLTNSAFAAGGGNAFIAQYNTNGGVNWAQRGGGTTADGAFSVDISPLGYAVVGGAGISSPSTIGDSTLHVPGFFLAGYSATGSVRWLKNATAPNMSFPFSLSHDASGNIYASGYFNATLAIDGHSLTDTSTIGNNEIFVAKFSRRTTAVPLVNGLEHLSLYPNPATTQLTVSTGNAAITDVVITDLLGHELSHVQNAGTPILHVDISTLSPGIYLARINGTEVRKFVKE